MKHIVLLSLTILISLNGWTGGKAKPLPTAEQVSSKIKSVDAAFDMMFVSDPFATKNPKVKPNTNLLDVEYNAIRDFIRSGKKNVRVILDRYGVDDPRFFDLMIEAKQKGIPFTFITDLNQFLDAEFKDGENFTAEFAKAKINDGKMGTQLKRILDAGYEFNHTEHGVFSQPLFNKAGDKMTPIMHEKALLLLSDEENVIYIGTANLTRNQRYNRLLVSHDQALIDVYTAHAQALVDTFKQGKRIKDLPENAPIRINYQDGSYQEVAFTDGKYNPNDRIAQIFTAAAQTPDKIKIKSVTFSEFVLTNRDVVNGLRDAMKAQNFLVTGVFDDKFVDLDGYGQVALLDGFDTNPQFGGYQTGVGNSIEQRTKLYVYQAPAVDPDTGEIRPITSMEGAPTAVKVWHDKTTIIETEINGAEYYYIFTGSLNNSGHFDNAELQTMLVVPKKSVLANAFVDSIYGVIKSEPEFVVELPIAVVRQTIAQITGHTHLEISVKTAKEVREELHKGNIQKLISVLDGMKSKPTTLTKKIDPATLDVRIKKVRALFEWYYKEVSPPTEKPNIIGLRKIATVLSSMFSYENNPNRVAKAISSLVWQPNVDEQKLTALTKSGLTKIGYDVNTISILQPKTEDALSNTVAKSAIQARWVFDWDDNIMFMPTKIFVFRKEVADKVKNPEEVISVSTKEFASIRALIGKEGKWKDYEIRNDNETGSFRLFRSAGDGPGGKNYFLDDILTAIQSKSPLEWQGPSWRAFQQALSNPNTVQNVYILTARGHDTDEVYEGLSKLKEKGFLKLIPPKDNFICVGGAANPSLAKAQNMIRLLDDLEKVPVNTTTQQVMGPDKTKGAFHEWGFSDDDYGNFEKARDELSAALKKGKYKNIKITLFYTGENGPIKQQAIVLTSDGKWRKLLKSEAGETAKILGLQPLAAPPCDIEFLPK